MAHLLGFEPKQSSLRVLSDARALLHATSCAANCKVWCPERMNLRPVRSCWVSLCGRSGGAPSWDWDSWLPHGASLLHVFCSGWAMGWGQPRLGKDRSQVFAWVLVKQLYQTAQCLQAKRCVNVYLTQYDAFFQSFAQFGHSPGPSNSWCLHFAHDLQLLSEGKVIQ